MQLEWYGQKDHKVQNYIDSSSYNTFAASALGFLHAGSAIFPQKLDSELTFEMEMVDNKVNTTDNHSMLRLSEAPTGSI
jgi:hypothetical protein